MDKRKRTNPWLTKCLTLCEVPLWQRLNAVSSLSLSLTRRPFEAFMDHGDRIFDPDLGSEPVLMTHCAYL